GRDGGPRETAGRRSRPRRAYRPSRSPARKLSRARARAQRTERDAGIEELENLARSVALLRHPLGAPLAHAGAMSVAASGETRPLTVHGHREQRRLEGVVADHPAEVVAAQARAAAVAVHGH